MNALAWAPHSSCHICSAGDDAQALIWDLSTMSHPMDHGLGAASPVASPENLQFRRKTAIMMQNLRPKNLNPAW